MTPERAEVYAERIEDEPITAGDFDKRLSHEMDEWRILIEQDEYLNSIPDIEF